MKKVILAVLALVPALAFATPGAYVQLQGGGNWVDAGSNNGGFSSFTGFAGGAGVGYLWGSNSINYGLEADALWYPNSTSSSQGVTLKDNGYNLSLLAVLKYTDCSSGFVAFGKAGAAYVHQSLSASGFGSTFGNFYSGDDVAPEGDLGVGYQFSPNWEMDLTGNYVYTNNHNTGNNANLLLGVTYRFV